MPKKLTDKDVISWLESNAPHIKLLEWSGRGTLKSKFIDINRNVEFEYIFSSMKGEIIKGRNILYGASEEEIKNKRSESITPEIRKKAAQKAKKTFMKKYGVDNPNKTKEVRDKIEKTNIEKYGTKAPAQNKEIKEKTKETFINNWGVDNPNKKREVREKIVKTNIKKYGTENPLENKLIRNKVKKTILERYGQENASQSKEIKEKIKKINLKKYGVEHTFQIEEVRKKGKQTMIEKYGVENPLQNKEIKEKVKQTNLERYGFENPSQCQEVKNKVYNKKLKKGYITNINGKSLNEIALEKKVSYTVLTKINREYGKDFVLKYDRKFTSIELRVKEFLDSLGVQYIFNNKIQGPPGTHLKFYKPDFLLEKYNLIIECDGDYWHAGQEEKDRKRNEYYVSLGYNLLIFSGDQINNNFDYVKKQILKKIKG